MDGVTGLSILLRAKQALKWVFKPVLAVRPLPLMMCCIPYVSTYTGSLLWHPELVWPSAGMWSEAGNVWAMKACVYPGYSHPPPPARGKTDTTRIALFILFDAISFCLLFKPPSFALCGVLYLCDSLPLIFITDLWIFFEIVAICGGLARDISRRKCHLVFLK